MVDFHVSILQQVLAHTSSQNIQKKPFYEYKVQ